jgi:hypothetical protein
MSQGGQRKRTLMMRPRAKEVQGHRDELCVVGKSDAKGKEASTIRGFYG